MLIVPIDGDSIEASNGSSYMVSGVSVLPAAEPVCFVADDPDFEIGFKQIRAINSAKVELAKAPNHFVFSTLGLKRKHQLPQPGDQIDVDGSTYTVSALKLHVRGQLTSGLLIACTDERGREFQFGLGMISKIHADVGSIEKLKKVYADYLGA